VQIGSLYPPTLLPDEPLPRKSPHHRKGLRLICLCHNQL
jgi:hypothetical protein